jgi:hypothetical protein
VLALLLFATVREPARTMPAGPVPAGESFLATASFLLHSRTFVHMVAGGAFVGVSLYASLVWNPAFLVRVHDFSLTEVGNTIGPLRGLAGLGGVIFGGWLADRLGRRDAHWRLAVPGIACILVLPADLVFLLSGSIGWSRGARHRAVLYLHADRAGLCRMHGRGAPADARRQQPCSCSLPISSVRCSAHSSSASSTTR